MTRHDAPISRYTAVRSVGRRQGGSSWVNAVPHQLVPTSEHILRRSEAKNQRAQVGDLGEHASSAQCDGSVARGRRHRPAGNCGSVTVPRACASMAVASYRRMPLGITWRHQHERLGMG